MKFDSRIWTDEELLVLYAALKRCHGSYAHLTPIFGDLLIALDARGLSVVKDTK